MSQAGHHGRDVAVDVMQMHNVGLEVVKHPLECRHDVAMAHHPHESLDTSTVEVDLRRKVFAPG